MKMYCFWLFTTFNLLFCLFYFFKSIWFAKLPFLLYKIGFCLSLWENILQHSNLVKRTFFYLPQGTVGMEKAPVIWIKFHCNRTHSSINVSYDRLHLQFHVSSPLFFGFLKLWIMNHVKLTCKNHVTICTVYT